MNLTYLRLELTRLVRDRVGFLFTIGIPVMMYLIFGASRDGSVEIGHGNVAMYVLVSMAAYGAVTATVGLGSSVAAERGLGWSRQLGLTPLRDASYVAVKAVVAVVVAALPLAAIYALGSATGAHADARVWLWSLVLSLVGAAMFTLFGVMVGQLVRNESAGGVASGAVVLLGFLGDMFVPLSGTLLAIAKVTPLYGLVQLVRYPLTEGQVLDGTELVAEPLWVPATNLAAWLAIFAVVTIWSVRRGRARQ